MPPILMIAIKQLVAEYEKKNGVIPVSTDE